MAFPNKRGGKKRPLRPPSPLPKPYHHCLEQPSTTRRHTARECSATYERLLATERSLLSPLSEHGEERLPRASSPLLKL